MWDLEHAINTWRQDGVLLRYTMFAARHNFGKPGGFNLDAKEDGKCGVVATGVGPW